LALCWLQGISESVGKGIKTRADWLGKEVLAVLVTHF
jgi:hypothetical protein